MDCLAAVNRVSDLIRTNKPDSDFKNENYCKGRFGIHTTHVITDAIDSSRYNKNQSSHCIAKEAYEMR